MGICCTTPRTSAKKWTRERCSTSIRRCSVMSEPVKRRKRKLSLQSDKDRRRGKIRRTRVCVKLMTPSPHPRVSRKSPKKPRAETKVTEKTSRKRLLDDVFPEYELDEEERGLGFEKLEEEEMVDVACESLETTEAEDDFEDESPDSDEKRCEQERLRRIKGQQEKMNQYIVKAFERLDISVTYALVNFIRLVAEDVYPPNNIALRLFCDTVDFHTKTSSTNMRFPEDTLRFWQAGYYLFHGKFLRFMGGPKGRGLIVTGKAERGKYLPVDSSINFVVPSVKVISNYNPCDIPAEIPPGIIYSNLNIIQESDRCRNAHVLSCDGKKIAAGLDDQGGDIDLFGFEEKPTVTERVERVEAELNKLQEIQDIYEKYGNDIPTPYNMSSLLRETLLMVSNRIKDLRILKVGQEKNLKKFIKMVGDLDWRETKQKFAISETKVKLHRIDAAICKLLDLSKTVCAKLVEWNGSRGFRMSDVVVDQTKQSNMVLLKEFHLLSDGDSISKYCKQRTEPWFDIRRELGDLTGSTLHGGVGLETLKKQKELFDKRIHGVAPPEPTPEQRTFMDHGTAHENDALVTLAARVLPALYPQLAYFEEGCYCLCPSADQDNECCLVVSPDGSIREYDMETRKVGCPHMAVEVKCPYPNAYTPPVHYSFPHRYVCQVLAEMKAMDVNKLVYASWSSESTTVFEVTFDEILWREIIGIMETSYDPRQPERPQKVSPASKQLKTRLQNFVRNNVTFICEVPSLKTSAAESTRVRDDGHGESPYDFPIEDDSDSPVVKDFQAVLIECKKVVREAHQICRRKAFEIFAFTLSEANRAWHPQIPHALTVAYGLKGFSLSLTTAREMLDRILNVCYEKGIRIPCVCFDGQWIQMITRDRSGNPLTRLQQLKDTWKSSLSAKRPDLVNSMKRLGDVDIIVRIESTNNKQTIDISSAHQVMKSVRFPERNSLLWRREESRSKATAKAAEEPVNAPEDMSVLPASVLNDLDLDALTEIRLTDIDENVATASDMELPDLDENENIVKDERYTKILNFLRIDDSETADKWIQMNDNEFNANLTSGFVLNLLTLRELDVIIKGIFVVQLSMKRSMSKLRKADKINFICDVFGNTDKLEPKPGSKVAATSLMSLRDITWAVLVGLGISSLPKPVLASLIAQSKTIEDQKKWEQTRSAALPIHVRHVYMDESVDEPYWYYLPGYDFTRNEPELHCYDGSHLLTNLRIKICKDGLPQWGIRKEAWYAVCERFPKVLNAAIVKHLIDKQNAAFAKRIFTREVTDAMSALSFNSEAEFGTIIREWYEAEDTPGLSAEKRYFARQRLKDYFLQQLDFHQFPAPGTHVRGMPYQMFEGFLCSVDAHTLLYSVCPQSYNQRAVGTLDTENGFQELTDAEPCKLGCPKATSIRRLMAHQSRLLKYRCDSSASSFYMSTSKSPVYDHKPVVEMNDPRDDVHHARGDDIVIRDHFFDTMDRARTKPQHKSGRIADVDEQSRGVRGVRYYYKKDESFYPAHVRHGLKL